MKCKKCGCEFDEGIFCPNCGERKDVDTQNNGDITPELDEKNNEEVQKLKMEKERLAQENAEKEAELAKLRLAQEQIVKEKAAEKTAKSLENEGKLMATLSLDNM